MRNSILKLSAVLMLMSGTHALRADAPPVPVDPRLLPPSELVRRDPHINPDVPRPLPPRPDNSKGNGKDNKKKSATVVTMQNLLTGETHTYSAMDPFIGTSASFADTPGFWYVTIIQDGQLIYADTVMY